MRSNIAGDFGFNVVINLIVKVVWLLGIEVAVQNTLGPESYGQYFVFWNLCSLFYIVLDAGLTQYLQRNIALSPDSAGMLLANLLPVKLILAVLYIALILSIAVATSIPASLWPLLIWVAINQVLVSGLHFLRAFVAAFHFYRLDGLLSVSDRLVSAVVCGLLLWMPSDSFTVYHFLLALSAGWASTCVLSFIAIRKRLEVHREKVMTGKMKEILTQSWPFGVFIALMAAYTRMDAVMLEILLPDGTYHAGIYASAYRLLDAANIFGLLLAGILLPSFAAHLRDYEAIRRLVKLGLSLVWIPAVVVIIVVYFYASDIYGLLYHADKDYGSGVLQVLLLNFMPVCLIYVYSTLLTAYGNLRLLNYLTGTTLLANMVLNLILIPGLKATGAAWATLGTQSFFALICIFFTIKIFGHATSKLDVLRLFLIAAITWLIGYLVQNFSMPWFAGTAVISIGAIAAGFLFRILSLKLFRTAVQVRNQKSN